MHNKTKIQDELDTLRKDTDIHKKLRTNKVLANIHKIFDKLELSKDEINIDKCKNRLTYWVMVSDDTNIGENLSMLYKLILLDIQLYDKLYTKTPLYKALHD